MTPSGYRTSVRQKTKEEVQDTESKEQIEQRVKKYLAGNTVLQDEVAAKNLDLFTVDAKETTELKKNWNAIINIGKVDALLDSEMQQQVLIMKQELGFRYVRVWNIFVQDMYEEKDGSWHYNFSRVDRGLDFLVENQLKPYIELSFKPIHVSYTLYSTLTEKENDIISMTETVTIK